MTICITIFPTPATAGAYFPFWDSHSRRDLRKWMAAYVVLRGVVEFGLNSTYLDFWSEPCEAWPQRVESFSITTSILNKGLFAVELDVNPDSSTNNSDDIAEKKQEILRRADDPSLGLDAVLVDDKLYFVTNTNVDEGTKNECNESRIQYENSMFGMKKFVSKVLGDDIGNSVHITRVPGKEKATGNKELLLRCSSTIQTIQYKKSIKGVTIVDDKIFSIGYYRSQVKVYDSHSLTALRDINIPGMMLPEDIAGCSYKKALYVRDQRLVCIHRVDLANNSATRWKMRENHLPRGLSVTAAHTLLVNVWIRYNKGESSLLEYTTDGELMREIRFDRSIVAAYQTVQLSHDQFIVSHGNLLHRVCLINSDGHIIKSYGSEWGGGEGKLDRPRSLAIDDMNKHIFLADCNNHRVLLFDADLTYIGQVNLPPDLLYPHCLYFDSSTDRLFVSAYNNDRLYIISPPP